MNKILTAYGSDGVRYETYEDVKSVIIDYLFQADVADCSLFLELKGEQPGISPM